MTRALILALFLARPASAGGLATSPVPPDRPACADGEPEGGDVQFPAREPVQPGPAIDPPTTQPDKPQPEKEASPCKSRKLGC